MKTRYGAWHFLQTSGDIFKIKKDCITLIYFYTLLSGQKYKFSKGLISFSDLSSKINPWDFTTSYDSKIPKQWLRDNTNSDGKSWYIFNNFLSTCNNWQTQIWTRSYLLVSITTKLVKFQCIKSRIGNRAIQTASNAHEIMTIHLSV